jgi:hypothetical protein
MNVADDQMLARRSITDPAELAFYRCWTPRPVGLPVTWIA